MTELAGIPIELLSGLGVNGPLAFVCWKLWQALRDARDKHISHLQEDLEHWRSATERLRQLHDK